MKAWARIRRDLRFAAGLLRKRPFQVLLQVTNRCNMTCDFCDFWPHGDKAGELGVADYAKLSDDLAELGCFLVSVEGGEPLVRKDLLEIIRALARHHVPVLYTNGWFVTAELAEALFEAGVAQVGVSIDYASAARHDARRGIEGATERAWRAIEHLKAAATHPERQVHVMSVLMEENREALEPLLKQSAAAGVGHCVTLVATQGFRRGSAAVAPAEGLGAFMLELWARYPHLRTFRDYLGGIDPWLAGDDSLPRCNAGIQSFNVDHVGGVSTCIERIDRSVGNLREAPLAELLARMESGEDVSSCQDCWTLCRGFSQLLGEGGERRAWHDLSTRMRSS